MMIASSSSSVPGIWISRGSLERVVDEQRLAVLEAPPGQPLAARDREVEDRLGVLVTRVDGPQHRSSVVDAVDAEVVVPDHALQAVGDDVEHAGRLERGQQAAVDLEQPSLRVGLASQRRRLLAQLLVEAGVRDRDRGLAGEHLEQLGIGVVECVTRLRVDGERADGALLADERGAHHRANAVLADVSVRRLGVDEGVVDEVVAGEDDLALADRAARHPLLGGDGRFARRALDGQVDGRVAEGPMKPAALDHQLDPSAVGVEQAHRLVERALQHVAGVVDGGDARGDRAEGALGLDSMLELLVQARVAEHDGGLAGEGTEQLGGAVGEGVRSSRVGADRADRPLLADERRAHLRAVAGPGDPLVGARGVRERRVGEVVAGPHHAPVGDGDPGDPLADAHRHLVGRRHVRAGAEDGPEVRELVRAGADLVDDDVVGMQQPLRLVDRPQQDRGRVAQRGDRGGDLAQRALCLDLVRELVRPRPRPRR